MKCIYCFEEKDDSEFTTVEHIIPHACDSDHVRDEIFLTKRVCNKCNHLCGLFVDGAFLKSWFINNDRCQSALYYLDKQDPGPIPFIYLGVYEKISSSNEICEYWMDFHGNRIYHFHEEDKKYLTYAGGNPVQRKRKKNAGSAFLVFSENVSDKPFWIISTVKSFEKFFHNESKYILNGDFYDKNEKKIYTLDTVDSQEKAKKINEILNDVHKISSRISLHAHTRFLSKISLGLGFTLLGESFLDTKYARDLRDSLWSFPEDKKPRLKGQTSIEFPEGGKNLLNNTFSWKGGNVLILQKSGKKLGFHLYLFGKFVGTHPICDDISMYTPSIAIDHKNSIDGLDGSAFIWIPERDIEPVEISLIELMMHNLNKIKHPKLLYLESLRNNIDELLSIKDLPSRGINK